MAKYPPLHPPFPSKFYTKNNNFPPFSLHEKKLMRIFAALKEMMVVHSDGQRLLLSTDCVGFFYAHNRTYMAVAIP